MSTVTLLELRSRARTRANMPVAGFVSDAELDQWINEGLQTLHGKLVSAYAEEYVSSQAVLTTVANQSDYDLTSIAPDFYKLWGIDLTYGGKTYTLRPFNRADRNIQRDVRFSFRAPPRYLLTGQTLRILPIPPATTGVIYYAPEATKLVLTTDTLRTWNGWEKYVVLYAAIQMLLKEESDARPLQTLLNQMDATLDEATESRDASFPHKVVDTEAIDTWDQSGWP